MSRTVNSPALMAAASAFGSAAIELAAIFVTA